MDVAHIFKWLVDRAWHLRGKRIVYSFLVQIPQLNPYVGRYIHSHTVQETSQPHELLSWRAAQIGGSLAGLWNKPRWRLENQIPKNTINKFVRTRIVRLPYLILPVHVVAKNILIWPRNANVAKFRFFLSRYLIVLFHVSSRVPSWYSRWFPKEHEVRRIGIHGRVVKHVDPAFSRALLRVFEKKYDSH